MIEKGAVDDLDYIIGGHIGLALKELGQISFNIHSFMAMSRFEVTLRPPVPCRSPPDLGKNALLGSCAAIANLYAIARQA